MLYIRFLTCSAISIKPAKQKFWSSTHNAHVQKTSNRKHINICQKTLDFYILENPKLTSSKSMSGEHENTA